MNLFDEAHGPTRSIRECTICGERVTMSNATEAWEKRHEHAPTDDERAEAERVQKAAWAEIHGQDPQRKYSVAEVKQIVYSLDSALSSLLFRRTVQGEPLPACGYCGDRLGAPGCPAHGEPQGEPSDAAVREAVSAERKAIASLLMSLGDRMTGEGTQAGYYAAAHEVRQRERAALRAAAEVEGGNHGTR